MGQSTTCWWIKTKTFWIESFLTQVAFLTGTMMEGVKLVVGEECIFWDSWNWKIITQLGYFGLSGFRWRIKFIRLFTQFLVFVCKDFDRYFAWNIQTCCCWDEWVWIYRLKNWQFSECGLSRFWWKDRNQQYFFLVPFIKRIFFVWFSFCSKKSNLRVLR